MKAGNIAERRKPLTAGGLSGKIAVTIAIATLLVLANISSFAQAPPVVWAGQISSSYNTNASYGGIIALDKNVNFFCAGSFAASVLSVGNQTLTNLSMNLGLFDAFVVKQDSSGNFLWVRQVGGDGFEIVRGCTTDASGNLLLSVGSYSTNILVGTNILTGNGFENLVLSKYDPKGNLLWIRQAAGSGNVLGTGLAADASGNVFVSGGFDSTNLLLGTNLLAKTNPATRADFLAKLDGAGNVLWVRQININDTNTPTVGVDGQGNSYLLEIFTGIADFGGVALTNSSSWTLSIAKFDPSGNLLWAREAARCAGDFLVNSPAVDSQGNCHLIGENFYAGVQLQGTNLPVSGNGEDTFVAKYDGSGNLLWANGMAGTFAGSLSLDPLGNCYATGSSDSLVVDFGTIPVTNASPYTQHGFVVKYSSGGSLLWAKLLNSPGERNFGQGVADANGNVHFFGTAVGPSFLNLDGNIVPGPTDFGYYYFAATISGPQLSIQPSGDQIVLSWPTNAVGLSLETTTDLSTGSWSPVTNVPSNVGTQNIVSNAVAATNRFYRLRNF